MRRKALGGPHIDDPQIAWWIKFPRGWYQLLRQSLGIYV